MQSALLPHHICKEIDKTNKNFLWGDTDPYKKLHLKNWDTVKSPKFLGGLGIKKSFVRNKTLLAKHS